MKTSEVKGAVNAAWSASTTNFFKLDIIVQDAITIDVYPKTLDGELCGTSWRILLNVGIIVRYADNIKNGTSDVVEEQPFEDIDGIERIFTREFKSLDKTLRFSLENGGPEMGVTTRGG